jgi:sec-independent protein translocase protein TatA
MGEFSLAHILVVAVVAIVLFGRGKVSSLMGEVGRGISSFKKGIRDGVEDEVAALPATTETAPEPTRKG